MTIQEAAKELKMKPRTVEKYISMKRIEATWKLQTLAGGPYRDISWAALRAYQKTRRPPGRPRESKDKGARKKT